MQATLEGMDLGPLLGLYLQTFVVQVTMLALSAIIFVIVYGRMVEIYLMVSLAPIPFATFGNHEQSHTCLLYTSFHMTDAEKKLLQAQHRLEEAQARDRVCLLYTSRCV